MKFIDRLIYLLIEYNKKAPWWRRVVGIANEGGVICIMLSMWYMILFLLSVIFLSHTHPRIFGFILYGTGGAFVITIVLAICFSIRQNKGKIKNVPISIPDKYLKVFLAIYIVVPFALALLGFFMLATHAFFGWFSFMN